MSSTIKRVDARRGRSRILQSHNRHDIIRGFLRMIGPLLHMVWPDSKKSVANKS